jgi:hypothetical protein
MPTRKAAPAALPDETAIAPLKPAIKLSLSALIAFHLTAVFWGPFTFACNIGPTSSPFADTVSRWLRPYIAAMYLDHGYFFFAPNPGPSHLVRYQVAFDDGREPLVGTFPDLATQEPRLLYHRHFMLSESLYSRFAPPTPPPEPTPPPITASAAEKARYSRLREAYPRDVAAWQHQRRQYEALWKACEEHLRHEHGGSKVTLTRVEHLLLAPDDVRLDRRDIREAELYLDLPETLPPEPGP